MKKITRAVLGLFMAAVLFAGMSFAGPQDFVLINNTGADIYTVNISPSSSGDWEEDVMGSDILENGESVTVRFSVGSTRYWDIQAIFRDGTSISWYNIDLLETYTVTLNRDGSADLE